jgi:dienelactone hydrolase
MKQNSAAATPFDAEFSDRKPLHAFQKVLQVFALASLLISTGVSAEKVQFPGAKADGYAHMPTVSATLEMPEIATRPVPAVVVLHGSGSKDDYGLPDAAQTFLNQLTPQAKSLVSLQFYPSATHGWDSPPGRNRTIQDSSANEGKGGAVRFWPDSAVAEDSRAKVVAFFTASFAKP